MQQQLNRSANQLIASSRRCACAGSWIASLNPARPPGFVHGLAGRFDACCKLHWIRVLLAFCGALFLFSPQAMAQFTESYAFTNLDLLIPDGNASGLHDPRLISSEIKRISGARVRLGITGEFNGE